MHKLTRRIVSVVIIFTLLFAALVPSVSANHGFSCLGINGGVNGGTDDRFQVPLFATYDEYLTVTFTSSSHPNQAVMVSTLDLVTYDLIPVGNFTLPLTFTVGNDELKVYVVETVGGTIITAEWNYSCRVIGTACLINDGRLNSDDCGALVALYQDGTFIDAYGIDPASGEGVLVFRYDLSTAPDPITENTLLTEGTNPFNGQPIRLYKLAGGGYQLNSTQPNGEPYEFAWS
jgi:hypothetical protein